MQPHPTHILLVVEDDPFATQVERMLRGSKVDTFDIFRARTIRESLSVLKSGSIELVLLDLALPDGAGLGNVRLFRNVAPRVPVIVLGGSGHEIVALEGMHEGAQDYLLKDQLNPHLLNRAIRYAIERQKADMALLEAEEKYRGIFEHLVEGIFQTSPKGRFLMANTALARMYGYSTAEELIENITDIARHIYVEAGRRDEFIRLMERNDVVKDFESQIWCLDGRKIWITENVRAIRDSAGRLLYYEGTVEDVTQRKRAEEDLRQSEALYHSLVENLPQNIFRKDRNGQFTFANQRFCNLLGKPLSEIIGKTDMDLFPSDMAVKNLEEDRRIIQTGETLDTVKEYISAKGEKRYVHVVKTPLVDADQKICGLQSIFWDITARIRAEEQARQANIELSKSQEALRAKTQQLEEDLQMACELQQTLLPQQYPCFPPGASQAESAFRFFHRYHPTGAVGGDYFNVTALSESKAAVLICDVMGHGVRSALVTAMLRALQEELKALADKPGEFLSQLNRSLRAILRNIGSPVLTTAFYLVADFATQQMRYANAGHPKPLLLHRRAGGLELLENGAHKPMPALGLFEDLDYKTFHSPIHHGDMVMLFTDGLFEVEGPGQKFYSHEMLVEAVKRRVHMPTTEMFDDLLAEIQQFAGEQGFVDDVCVIGMEVAPSDRELLSQLPLEI